MQNIDPKSFLKRISEDFGFDDIGFAAVEKLEKEYEFYLNWLDKGFHGKMQYLARREGKRRDISMVLDGAATVIVLLQNYNTNYKHSNSKHLGKISRYAWGDDYHDVMKKKLKKISNLAGEFFPENKFKVYVDTGPVLEKQWAVRAGLGWQGKNSLLLNKHFGSYVFIGIMITDLVINPDNPVRDMCGKCTACIDACPVDAIVEPKVVDSRKCLSYWTIETKEDTIFPKEISDKLNGWLFGCDICQEVCPWNSKNIYTNINNFKPRNGETELSLDDILNMTESEFRLRFKNSPIKRSKLPGLKRNAKTILKK